MLVHLRMRGQGIQSISHDFLPSKWLKYTNYTIKQPECLSKMFCYAEEGSPLCSFPADKTPITAPLSFSNWLCFAARQPSQKKLFPFPTFDIAT